MITLARDKTQIDMFISDPRFALVILFHKIKD